MVSITTIHVQIRIGFAAWIFLILFLQSYTIRSQNLMWVKQLGGTASDEGRAICVDDSGNILVTGAFEQNVDFDPGPAILEFNAPSSNGAFITKFDQTGQLLWAVPLVGNVSNTNNYGLDIATDRSGNVYVSGFFTNTVDFDPGPAEFNLTASAQDVYVLKLDSYGHFVWAKQFGGISANFGYGIAVDGSQQVYVTGYFQYTVDFDPGPNTHYLTPVPGIGGDIFVVKLDAIGNFIWAEQLGGAGIDQGNDIAVDKNGNIYLTGTFQNTVDFDPGNGTYLLSSLDFDGFVCKLGANGSFIWARQFGGLNSDEGRSICVDAGGNVFVAGDFHGNGSFGSSLIISAGNSDAFVMKMDPNGNLVWINQYGSSGDDFANGVTERDGVIIVGGGFQGAIDFDTSPNTYNLTGPGAFVTKMSSDGRFLWADKLGSMVYSVGITSMYESVASGYFWNSVDFDPGGSDLTLTSAGYSDIFIWKGSSCSTSSGDTTPIVACDSFKWINGVNYSDSNNTAIFNVGARNGCDSLVRLHLTVLKSTSSIQAITSCGSYKWVDNVTYTSSTSTPFITLKNKAGCDSLVHLNLKINGPTYSTQNMEACSSYKWIDGVTYTASTNTPYVTLVNKSGCDSTVNLNLKIRFPSSSTQNIEACSSYKWIDGVNYTSSTSAPFITLANKAGCDSTVHLNLKIKSPSSSTQNIEACSSFKWIDGVTYTTSTSAPFITLANKAGCDSIVHLNLKIRLPSSSTQNIEACSSYKWIDGVTYSTSTKDPIWIVQTKSGCDSVIHLNLTIKRVDTSISTDASSIMALAQGATFEWIDCNTGKSINTTGPILQPGHSGSFAVEITQGGCTAISSCATFTITGLEATSGRNLISPNPSKETFAIIMDAPVEHGEVSVLDDAGRMILSMPIENQQVIPIRFDGSPGVYFVQCHIPGRTVYTFRIIKE